MGTLEDAIRAELDAQKCLQQEAKKERVPFRMKSREQSLFAGLLHKAKPHPARDHFGRGGNAVILFSE